MFLHEHITPRLPVFAGGPDPAPDGRDWPRLSRRRDWLRIALTVSLLLHLTALFVVLFEPTRMLPKSKGGAPVEWAIEVEDNKPSGAPDTTQTPPPTPPPPPPSPAATPSPPPAPPPPEETKPTPESKPQPLPQTPPAPPVVTPQPAPSEPAMPQGNVATQSRPAVPPPSPPPNPQPQTPPTQTHPVIPLSPFASATPFAQLQQKKAEPLPPSSVGNGFNLALGKAEHTTPDPPRRNLDDDDFDMQVEGAQVGDDWMRQVRAYWVVHRRYPQEAVVNEEQGELVIRFHVDRHGAVSDYELLQSSGSKALDTMTRSTFAYAKLPPFPFNTPENDATLTIHVLYELIGR